MGRPIIETEAPNPREIARFWTRVDRRGPTDCWLWLGGTSIHGYGIARLAGLARAASRWAWIIQYGTIPPGIYVLHRCDVRLCCNPTHLFLGSQSDNIQDMDRKGRRARGYRMSRRGEAHQAARLSDLEVAAIRESIDLGESRRSIARRFGVSHTYVGMLARGEMRT